MPVSTYKVRYLVQEVRRRWRRRALLQGLAVTLLTAGFLAILLLILYTRAGLPAQTIGVTLTLASIAVLAVLIRYVIIPLRRKLDDRQIALYVEEQVPDLEDRLNSAVEITGGAESGLSEQLIEDTSRKIRALPAANVVPWKRVRMLGYSAAAVLGVIALFSVMSADQWRAVFSAARITPAAVAEMPYMTVHPGSVEVEQGGSQEVIVTLRDDAGGHDVLLHYRDAAGAWVKEPMQRALGRPDFLFEFIDVQEPLEYFILHDDVQSDVFRIDLYTFPAVGRVDVHYRYPSYTGLPARQEDNAGDIRGLKGSTVTVVTTTTGNAETATMVLDTGRRIDMEPVQGGRFRATFTLSEDAYYHIELLDEQEKRNRFPDEFLIQPIEDLPPQIMLTDPQQDVRVNAIEEVRIAARVQDDYGVTTSTLKFSVNGAEEEAIPFMKQAEAGELEVEGDYLMFLEDYALQPGDVITYYVEANDAFPERIPEASDMYFIEVIPFDQRFSQAQNMGMPGGGGQQSALVLSQQEIIAATWKLHRQRQQGTVEEFESALEGLTQAQENLQRNIEERINSTAFSLELRENTEGQQIVEFLRKAVEEMGNALIELEEGQLQEALTPERRALTQLLRADALNNERQVGAQQNQGGGGGGSNMEDRMTELMDLELDISRDKYEMPQQRQQQQEQTPQGLDETLERIRELARRQQRIMNQQQQQENLKGEDKKRYVERLQREQDELRERTENLARQMSRQQQESQMQQGVQRALDQMREAERALEREDWQTANARQQQALNELDQLQEELRTAGAESTREMLDDFLDEFDNIREQERQLGEDIKEAFDEAVQTGRIDPEAMEELQENRTSIRTNLDRLQKQAEAVEKGSREEDPDLASDVRNLMQRMRREELDQKMDDSQTALDRQWLDFAMRLEGEIQSTIERLATQMQDLAAGLPRTDEEQIRRALADLEQLREHMENLQQQSQEAQGTDPGSREGRAQARRAQREAEQAQEALERLQQQLEGNAGMQRAMDQVRNAVQPATDASNTGVLLDEESGKAFFDPSVFESFSSLERELATELEQIETDKKLFGARKTDVPDEYREAVDRYYESLSRSSRRGSIQR